MSRDGRGVIAKRFWTIARARLLALDPAAIRIDFCGAIENRGLGIGELDGAAIERLQRSVVGAIPEYARGWASSA